MDVYLVPAGPDRHVLYCEPAGDAPVSGDGAGRGIWRRLHGSFLRVLAFVEREHDSAPNASALATPPPGLLARFRSHALRWLAERVAEQRVLWRLQGQARVRAFHPDAIDRAGALAAIEQSLRLDLRRHVIWLAIDSILLLVSLLLTPIPGPNMLGYYFTFRVVGHVLAIRGARQGLARVAWDLEPSSPLGELAGAARLAPAERDRVVRSVADRLRLPRLPRFCERILSGSA